MWSEIAASLQASFNRVLSGLVGILPTTVAMVVSVAFAALIGWVVAWVLTALLRAIKFDRRLDQLELTALAEWSPGRSPTRLVGRLVFWTVVLIGVLVGLAAMEAPLMATMVARLIAYLPNAFVAILLVLLGAVLARFLGRGALITAVNLRLQSAGLISVGVKWMVRVLAVAMALEHLSIGGDILKLAFAILFGGLVLTLALAIGLGSKDAVSRTWERRDEQRTEPAEAPFQHL